jgi:hypothetical protein
MNVLGTKKEVLPFLQDMVIDHVTKSPEFILLVYRLEKRICIGMAGQIKERMQMDTVEPLGRMPF